MWKMNNKKLSMSNLPLVPQSHLGILDQTPSPVYSARLISKLFSYKITILKCRFTKIRKSEEKMWKNLLIAFAKEVCKYINVCCQYISTNEGLIII